MCLMVLFLVVDRRCLALSKTETRAAKQMNRLLLPFALPDCFFDLLKTKLILVISENISGLLR